MRILKKQHSICGEYQGLGKVRLSQKWILQSSVAFHTEIMKGPKPYLE